MSEVLDRLDRRIAAVRRATLICGVVLAAAVVALGCRFAFQSAAFLSSRHRLDYEAARQRRLTRAVARLPRNLPATAKATRLAPDATFVALAGHIGTLARIAGGTVRTLERADADTPSTQLRPPAGEPEVAAQLQLDTTYTSALDFLRALGDLPLPVAPTEIDLESDSVPSSSKEPRLALRLKLIAYGTLRSPDLSGRSTSGVTPEGGE